MSKATIIYPEGFGGIEEEAVKFSALHLYFTQQTGNVLEVFRSAGPPLKIVFTDEVIRNYRQSGVIIELS